MKHIFNYINSNPPLLTLGPFVMNTEAEIREAISDYRLGKNGFENARTWNSFIVRKDESVNAS